MTWTSDLSEVWSFRLPGAGRPLHDHQENRPALWGRAVFSYGLRVECQVG
ncbi:hypothetical protein GMO_06090 [Gluconobacter morbifer G707]|uniref:Uncharacterized protein n=1 Tax=Gluconobacter morbifer G707 TaxID=1088869 RepID=G6XGJ4_9PROT|nr:hypothetical protein GMO_06090 [Gluconobacter morbifer G707]